VVDWLQAWDIDPTVMPTWQLHVEPEELFVICCLRTSE